MNRRRVGLAVLAGGAAAAWRRRLRTQFEPGTANPRHAQPAYEPNDVAAANGLNPISRDAASATTDSLGAPSNHGDTDITSSANEAAGEVGRAEQGDVAPAAFSTEDAATTPEADDPKHWPHNAADAETIEPELLPTMPAVLLSTVPSDGSVVAAGADAADAETIEPELLPTMPAVSLPTMPAAGTADVGGPDAIVIPRADGSQTHVSAIATSATHKPLIAATAIEQDEVIDRPQFQTPPSAQAMSSGPTSFEPESIEAAPSDPSMPSDQSMHGGPTRPESLAGAGAGGAETGRPWYRKRFYGWSIWTIALLGLLGTTAIAMSVWRTPYYRLQPGSVYDTIERVEAPGDLVFVPDGDIGFVTVSQTANITPWQWIDAKLDENVRIRHEDEVRGNQTADEARAVDLRRMQVSKNSAVVVALEKLGFDLITTPIGVEVARVFECSAADGNLGTGDLIVGVNGVPTPDGQRLVEELISIGVDQEVELLVERIDPANPTQSMRTDLVGLTLGSADDPCLEEAVRAEEPRPFIGIMTETIFEEELPIDLEIRTGRVGGPSAGLAFTLAIMDVLSEGELTNGLNIVATGSIDRSGQVGPVGGIHQKTIAAERSGADVFLVPACCDNFVDRESGEPVELPSNFEEAQMHADDMIVIGVDNLDDALRAIGELGGNVDQFLTS